MNKNKEPREQPSSQKDDPGLQQCQIDIIKRAVRETFHAIIKIEAEVSETQKIRAALKRDLLDLKEGRLDRIVHRQKIDVVSKEHSIFLVEPKVEIGGKSSSQWYIPYYIRFRDEELGGVTINNSITKVHAGGACQLDNGEVKYL